MKRLLRLSSLAAAFALPFAAAAQQGINIDAIKKPYTDQIIYFINFVLVPVVMAIAFIVFIWGVYNYFIKGADDETSRSTGRQFTLWGVIGFVVILSLWGLVNLFMSTLGLRPGGNAPDFPTIGKSASQTGSGASIPPPPPTQTSATLPTGASQTSASAPVTNNVYCPDGSVVSDVAQCSVSTGSGI